jgi:hypothetical protein
MISNAASFELSLLYDDDVQRQLTITYSFNLVVPARLGIAPLPTFANYKVTTFLQYCIVAVMPMKVDL